jgi:alpha-glucosidase (family GH31 glycosyl hydrolase)
MNYSAPLDKLPLFVRSGAILPMYPAMMYDWERPTDTLTLQVYPSAKSSFTMYEDDGLTREHRQGIYATTKFESSVSENGDLNFKINKVEGEFNGRLKERTYLMEIHSSSSPNIVTFNGRKIKKMKSHGDLEKVSTGWYFDITNQSGIIHIKTDKVSTNIVSHLELKNKSL